MQAHQLDDLPSTRQTSGPTSLNLGTIGLFTSSGKHLKTDEFDLDGLIALQKCLDGADAYFFVKGDQLDECDPLSVQDLLQRTPLLLTSRGFYLVAQQAPDNPTKVHLQGLTITI